MRSIAPPAGATGCETELQSMSSCKAISFYHAGCLISPLNILLCGAISTVTSSRPYQFKQRHVLPLVNNPRRLPSAEYAAVAGGVKTAVSLAGNLIFHALGDLLTPSCRCIGSCASITTGAAAQQQQHSEIAWCPQQHLQVQQWAGHWCCQQSGLQQLLSHDIRAQHHVRLFSTDPQHLDDGRQSQDQQDLQHHRQLQRAHSQHNWHRSRVDRYPPSDKFQRKLDSSPGPSFITQNIMKAETAAQLLDVVVHNSKHLNRIHVIAALNKTASLWTTFGASAQVGPGAQSGATSQQQQLQLGQQQLKQLMLMLAGPFQRSVALYNCKEISSGLWAYASCQLQPPPQLLAAVAHHISSWDSLQNGQVKHFVTLGWAAVKLGCKDRRLYAAVAAAVQPHVQQLSPNQVSILLWTFARAQFRDEHILAQLSSRAKELLTVQQQQHEQHQQHSKQKLSKAAARKLKQHRFDPAGISSTVWALGALQWSDGDLVKAVAGQVQQVPYVYDIKPHEAVNLLKGFAVAAGAPDIVASYSEGGSNDTNSDDRAELPAAETASEAISSAVDGHAALSSSEDISIALWPAACAVAAAALRRLDEAGPAIVPRLLWSIASLHHAAKANPWQQRLSATASADGKIVFEQLCSALLLQWRRQAVQPTGLTVAAWALVDAQESGLTPPLLQQQYTAHTNASSTTDLSTNTPAGQLLMCMAAAVTQLARQSGQQFPLMPHHVADLAAAFARLGYMDKSGSSTAREGSSSASNGYVMLPSDALPAEGAPAAQSRTLPQQSQLESCVAEAVGALAAVAEQMASQQAAGEIDVYTVSKMLAGFGRMRVHNNSLYQVLVQHWTPEQLHACSNETLVGAIRAASQLHVALPHLLGKGVMLVHVWKQLLELCTKRWQRLSPEQRARLQLVSAKLPAEVGQQLPELAAAFSQVAAHLP